MSDHPPLVSVVMPAYNHARFVGAAIESVLRQTVSDFEFIVIEDGSTDATLDIVRSYSDRRITCHTQANQDAFNALNRGLRLARGEYLAVINSDDRFEPDRLAVLLEEARRSGAACVFTGVAAIDDGGRAIDDPAHPWNVWYAGVRALLICVT